MGIYSLDRSGMCPVDGSRLRSSGKCAACGYIQNAPHPPRIVVNGLAQDAPNPRSVQTLQVIQSAVTTIDPQTYSATTEWRCGYCGKVSGSKTGHASHMRSEERKRA